MCGACYQRWRRAHLQAETAPGGKAQVLAEALARAAHCQTLAQAAEAEGARLVAAGHLRRAAGNLEVAEALSEGQGELAARLAALTQHLLRLEDVAAAAVA
jgi:hypothetical protein